MYDCMNSRLLWRFSAQVKIRVEFPILFDKWTCSEPRALV